VGFGYGIWIRFWRTQLVQATDLAKDDLMASASKSRIFIEEFLPSEIPGERKKSNIRS
jgi:hypothetical protein